MQKTSKDFGKKEYLLNYTSRRWGLTKTSKVGEVMSLIRKCQPQSYKNWESWYFSNAHTKSKIPTKITPETLKELGERLYVKLTEIVIPEFTNAMQHLTLDDCVEYIFNLVLCRTFDGFIIEKLTVQNNLSKKLKDINLKESDPKLSFGRCRFSRLAKQ